ncbi:MAG: SMI1/KNR4 family protein [Rubripirellula sp.]
MSDPSTSTRPNSGTWSERFARRYHCALTPALADWLDREIWRQKGTGEYRDPVEIEQMLVDAPEPIWPGLMSCDLIPLISNSAGDWLCVRVNDENVAGQIVQWYHGGGDWIPWGNELTEAVVFDALVDRISPDSRRHAIPAEAPRPDSQDLNDPVLHWALSHMPSDITSLFHGQPDRQRIIEALLDARIAEVAVRCELMLISLSQPSIELLEKALGDQSKQVGRSRLTEWVFDVDRIPSIGRESIEATLGTPLDGHDWKTAAEHASVTSKIAPELAWPWEIVGYQAERSGNQKAAIQAYIQAANCSVFTDQSVRLNTHWESDHSSKFSIARLAQLAPEARAGDAYFREMKESDPTRRRSGVTNYWMRLGSEYVSEGNFVEALRCFMAAGWDIGAEPITIFAQLLDSISSAAERCGQHARAEVAATHRRCLQQRYGL